MLTPFEEFAGRLKLDSKSQLPAAQEVFSASAQAAAPIGIEMLQLRQKLLNLALKGNTQDMKAVQDAYAAAAARMAGVEAAAFTKVYGTLRPINSRTPRRPLRSLPGFFNRRLRPPAAAASAEAGNDRATPLRLAVSLALAAAITIFVPVLAQRGGGGGRGAAPALALGGKSRLDTLDTSFTMTKDQKKAVRTILDDAYKRAAPVRDGLTSARAAVAAAIQENKGVDAAVSSYGEQAAAMMAIEMNALADVLKSLDAQQRDNSAAVSQAFYLMRGAFLDRKKWDDTPDGRNY